MHIALGTDHAGYHIKEALKKYLARVGRSIAHTGTSSEESADYLNFARAVA